MVLCLINIIISGNHDILRYTIPTPFKFVQGSECHLIICYHNSIRHIQSGICKKFHSLHSTLRMVITKINPVILNLHSMLFQCLLIGIQPSFSIRISLRTGNKVDGFRTMLFNKMIDQQGNPIVILHTKIRHTLNFQCQINTGYSGIMHILNNICNRLSII